MIALVVLAVLPALANVIATVLFAIILLVPALCLAGIAVVLAIDLGRTTRAVIQREPFPGFRTTRALWLRSGRMPILRRFFGPPQIEAHSLAELIALSPREFEHATATIFRARGYTHMEVVGQAGDYCVDVRGIDPAGRAVVIQCKRYKPSNKVGAREVQTFVGMATVHHRAERGIFVTTSTFTPNCWKIARDSGGRIELIDGRQLSQILAYEAPGAL